MTAPLSGFPPEVAQLLRPDGAIELSFATSLYPIDAIYGAAYVFIDRCFVLLDQPDPGICRVTLSWKAWNASRKGEPTDEALRNLGGEFANELLSCAWRAQIAKENRGIIEAVTQKAIAGAMGPPTLEDLDKFDFSNDALEDPLGIAMSWEEKYGKKKEPPSGGTQGPAT